MTRAPLTRNPSRLAFVSLLETGRWGASEYLWSETARLLAADGYSILACTHGWKPRPASLVNLEDAGVTLVERFPPRGARLRDFVSKLSKKSRPDALHIQSINEVIRYQPKLVLISCSWAMDPNLPSWCESLLGANIPYAVLIHTHAGHHWIEGSAAIRLRKILNRAVATYFVSEDNQALLIRQLGLSAEQTAVIRNPLAIDRETTPPWPKGHITRLACVGRLDPAQKGQDILIDCLRAPHWHSRSLNVGFFGEGPARSRLSELASELPKDLITFHGHTKHPASIWETHQMLVFPSRFEGLGLAVAEAQLCGRPVIITDCAARELVVDDHTGFIASAPTTPALQIALERAWQRKADWPDMGLSARRHMLATIPPDPTKIFADRLLCLTRK